MFSTPQSKAFFNQQIVKGKIVNDEITLVSTINDKLWEVKQSISEIIKLLWQDNKQQQAKQKLLSTIDMLKKVVYMVEDSNQNFSFEVSLRQDIKQLEHGFFKTVMRDYENKIKELKHSLLVLEQEVQELEKKGSLPYVENPGKNSVIQSKQRAYQEFVGKIQIINQILQFTQKVKLKDIVLSLVDDLLHKKIDSKITKTEHKTENESTAFSDKKQIQQQLNISQSIQIPNVQNNKPLEQFLPAQNIQIKPQNCIPSHIDIQEMLKLLLNWETVNRFKLSKNTRDLRQKIQLVNNSNKALKQAIRNYKKIMSYEQNQAMVRFKSIQCCRQQAIDFLRQMHQDLHVKFSKRNIYMMMPVGFERNRSKSATNLLYLVEEQQKVKQRSELKQMDSNLNDSFMQKCSYLISDRFMDEQNQEVSV